MIDAQAVANFLSIVLKNLPKLGVPILVLRVAFYILAALNWCLIITILAGPVVATTMWSDMRIWVASSDAHRFIAALGIFAAGGAFYLIRVAHRIVYGTAETLIGMAGAWAALSSTSTDPLIYSVGIVGSVYVIVRGLVSCSEGLKELGQPAPETALQRFQRFIEAYIEVLQERKKPSPIENWLIAQKRITESRRSQLFENYAKELAQTGFGSGMSHFPVSLTPKPASSPVDSSSVLPQKRSSL